MEEKIINDLKNRGIDVIAKDVDKNGCIMKALMVTGKKIAPTVYYEEILEKYEYEEAIDKIENLILKAMEELPDIDWIFDREYVLENLVISLRKSYDNNYIKRKSEYEGIEELLRIEHEEGFRVNVNESILENVNISESEAWQQAEKNTFNSKRTYIQGMSQVAAELMGEEMAGELSIYDECMWIISNKHRQDGASQILDKNTIRTYFEAQGIDPEGFIMIPSSIHECLIIKTDDYSLEEAKEMVTAVNHQEVLPEEVLADNAYELRL